MSMYSRYIKTTFTSVGRNVTINGLDGDAFDFFPANDGRGPNGDGQHAEADESELAFFHLRIFASSPAHHYHRRIFPSL